MMIRLLFALLMVLYTLVPAQTLKYGNLIAHVDSVIDGMPRTVSGGEYVSPDGLSRYNWKTLMQDVFAGQYESAQGKAALLGYEFVLFSDTTDGGVKPFYVLERLRDPGSPHWGVFILDPAPVRPELIIQSPHPKYDLNTGKQGIHVFVRTGARFYFLSGTHRCNSPAYSYCDGSTSACGTSEKHRLSDQPHTTEGTFQATTEVLEATFKDLIYVQLHGFAQRQGDPDIIMSNTHYGKPPVDYLAQLRDAFRTVDPSLTFKIAHLDNWTYLTATTNMQGRYINGVLNPCNISAKKNVGRFLHLEQAYEPLRSSPEKWDKMAQALILTFPAQSSTVAGQVAASPVTFTLMQNHPNPFNQETVISCQLEKAAVCELAVYDVLGRKLRVLASGLQPSGLNRVRWNGKDENGQALNSGLYFYRLQAEGVTAQGKMLLVR